ncbi:hypothetical protein C5H14_00285 [Xylella fastidiosa]|nr:hypothetical protein C5H14_00285 [Xylella fastidiosa]
MFLNWRSATRSTADVSSIAQQMDTSHGLHNNHRHPSKPIPCSTVTRSTKLKNIRNIHSRRYSAPHAFIPSLSLAATIPAATPPQMALQHIAHTPALADTHTQSPTAIWLPNSTSNATWPIWPAHQPAWMQSTLSKADLTMSTSGPYGCGCRQSHWRRCYNIGISTEDIRLHTASGTASQQCTVQHIGLLSGKETRTVEILRLKHAAQQMP